MKAGFVQEIIKEGKIEGNNSAVLDRTGYSGKPMK